MSRIFATLGADPHDLSYFWILPPLMGLIVQPLVGTASDKTWTRFGRRLPYLIVGAVIAVIVMCLLPNAGSFGLAVSSAIIIGLVALMLLDTSINMAMQPFKMLVGDMVNEKQKGLAYSIQSFLCNAGSIVGYVFPFLLTWIGFKNTAAAGVIPQTVVFSFYFGAAILLACVFYSLAKIKEWPPQTYAEYNGGGNTDGDGKEKNNLIKLLVKPPSPVECSVITPEGQLNFPEGEARLILADIYTHDPHSGELFLDGVKNVTLHNPPSATFTTSVVLDTESREYNDAGNWVGILFAVQAIGSVIWAVVLPMFRSRKFSYSLSLFLGAVGFVTAGLFTNQYLLFISFLLIGCAWAATLAWPFTILTNSLKSGNIGAYLGLFNCSICIPQIVGALLGGWILTMPGTPDTLAPQYLMMIIAGISLFIGSLAVFIIKEGDSTRPAPAKA